jgi:hypothetical protein
VQVVHPTSPVRPCNDIPRPHRESACSRKDQPRARCAIKWDTVYVLTGVKHYTSTADKRSSGAVHCSPLQVSVLTETLRSVFDLPRTASEGTVEYRLYKYVVFAGTHEGRACVRVRDSIFLICHLGCQRALHEPESRNLSFKAFRLRV